MPRIATKSLRKNFFRLYIFQRVRTLAGIAEGMKLSSRPASTVKVRASRFSGGALLSAMLRSARSRHGDFVFAGVGPVPRHVQEVQDSVGGVEDEALSEVVVEPTAFDASPGLEGLEAFRPAPLVPFRAALSFPGSPSVMSNGSRGFAVRQPTRRTRREGGRRSCRRAAQAGRGRIERHLVFLAHSLAAEFQRSSGAPAAPPRSPIDLVFLPFSHSERRCRQARGTRPVPAGSLATTVPSPSRSCLPPWRPKSTRARRDLGPSIVALLARPSPTH